MLAILFYGREIMLERNEIIDNRYKLVEKLRENGINPFPKKYTASHKSIEVVEKSVEFIDSKTNVNVAGRVLTIRSFGKTTFFHLLDGAGKVQIYVNANYADQESYALFKDYIETGDFIGVEGEVFKTKTEEITIAAKKITLLTKSTRPLPEKFHGLRDKETRYRQRYVDLIVNEDVKKTFVKRSKIISAMRRYLEDRDYLEVETPMLQSICGGALAKPFTTHHNALDIDLFMRIAPELYLKRLIVGGIERVFEINRNFRNEGISHKHNPEFTMMELYTTFFDYNDTIALTEDMLKTLFKEINGELKIHIGENEIDISGDWRKVSILDAIKEHSGVEFSWDDSKEEIMSKINNYVKKINEDCPEKIISSESEAESEAEKEIFKTLRLGLKALHGMTPAEMIVYFFEHSVEKNLIEPTFIIDYPKEISPLAKEKPENPKLVERFELYINGMEIANAYSELNDPAEQYLRFKEQVNTREAITEGFNPVVDEDYVRALEYGMPPTSGLGVGIDRLVMLMTNNESIRDVILFPLLRPESEVEEEEK